MALSGNDNKNNNNLIIQNTCAGFFVFIYVFFNFCVCLLIALWSKMRGRKIEKDAVFYSIQNPDHECMVKKIPVRLVFSTDAVEVHT